MSTTWKGRPTPEAEVEPDAVALLPYSSGTTGLPKGVMLTHSNLVASVRQVGSGLRMRREDTTLAVAPYFHIMGFMVSLAAPLVSGATVVTMPRFDVGELWVRGPQVMAGYLNRPDATAEILDEDGWLRTGDLGYVDESGNVFVVDRLKDLIKVSAYGVAPAELEALLLAHPQVADAAVIGRPDGRYGEVPVAAVVPRGGLREAKDGVASEAAAEEILAWVAGRVAPHKRLRAVRFVEGIPRTPSGKLLRRVLVEQELRPVA